MTRADPLILGDVAAAAETHAEAAVEERAWRRALTSDRTDIAARGALALGHSHQRAGDFQAARKMFERARRLRDSEVSPRATLELARLEAASGASSDASRLYEEASRSVDNDVVAAARYEHAELKSSAQDYDGARAEYRRVLQMSHPLAARAALALARLVEPNDPTSAVSLYRRALASDDADVVVGSAHALGLIYLRRSQLEVAEQYLRQAHAMRQGQLSWDAANELGKLLAGQGKAEGAEQIFGEVIREGDAESAAAAMQNLDALKREGRRSGATYDAYLCYSYADTEDVAAALQARMQTFAKPWFRARSARIFRPTATGFVTPDLWSATEVALDGSRFLVVVASPGAATSPWVKREITWWMQTKSTSTILLVLADGDIHWDAVRNDFDWSLTTALPQVIRGAFPDEPLYVDLRGMRSSRRADFEDPRFTSAVVDLLAPIFSVPKDDLTGEAILQRRRTVRMVRAAVAAVIVLTLMLAVFAVLIAARR